VPNCTKDKAEDPLGVCSILRKENAVITCPVRFRQDWLIATDAAEFFFPEGASWTSLTEVELPDKNGRSAGNVDVILVAYDRDGQVIDYGALEVQAVYIAGNVRVPFQKYMSDPQRYDDIDWRQRYYPCPDYLSSSRKRLAPQLIFKGGILHEWNRKMAVALDRTFYDTLPVLDEVQASDADMVWLVYDMQLDPGLDRYVLRRHNTVYTKFEPALLKITRTEAGAEECFIGKLQASLDQKLENDTSTDDATTEVDFSIRP
jgi:hypothetical protein